MPQSTDRGNTLAQHAPRRQAKGTRQQRSTANSQHPTASKQRAEISGSDVSRSQSNGQNYKLMKFMHNKIASEIIDAVVHALNAP